MTFLNHSFAAHVLSKKPIIYESTCSNQPKTVYMVYYEYDLGKDIYNVHFPNGPPFCQPACLLMRWFSLSPVSWPAHLGLQLVEFTHPRKRIGGRFDNTAKIFWETPFTAAKLYTMHIFKFRMFDLKQRSRSFLIWLELYHINFFVYVHMYAKVVWF